MPWVLPSTIARVAAAVADGAPVAAPFHDGMRGHPVGFSAACYATLAALTGDEGAKAVVAAHADSLARIDVDDAGTLRDVDTPADLEK
jgi:molybdenum cofactor cytidylyltransferase